MDLGLNEMQEMLKKSAREFFEKECPRSLVRAAEQEPSGYSPDLWDKMAKQGWTAMPVPQQYGGSGTDFLDLCVLYEEAGRALVPGPFLDTALAAYLIDDLASLDPSVGVGSPDPRKRWLPEIAKGSLIATIAYTEPAASYEPEQVQLEAEQTAGGEWRLNGTKLFISNAGIADLLLVVARTRNAINKQDGLTVFAVPRDPHPNPLPGGEGIEMELLDTIASDRQYEVTFTDVKGEPVGPIDGAWPALQRYLDRARVLTAVWSVGGAEYVLEMTVEYAKNRVQFGRPIGTFQAVSHRCADMAIDCDGMRFVSYHAAWRLSEGLAADQEIAIAKAWTADAYRRVTASGHQVHGGVAYMIEHDMQLYFRRAKAAELTFGDGDYHREQVALGLGL